MNLSSACPTHHLVTSKTQIDWCPGQEETWNSILTRTEIIKCQSFFHFSEESSVPNASHAQAGSIYS